MATYVELKRERELLADFGIPTQKHWPPRCNWYNEDGSLYGELPSDMYSRLRYMERGLRPEPPEPTLLRTIKKYRNNGCGHGRYLVDDDDPRETTLAQAVASLTDNYYNRPWRGTASDLLHALEGKTNDIPVDATRLSKQLNNIASQLLDNDVVVERVKYAKKREIVLRRQFKRL